MSDQPEPQDRPDWLPAFAAPDRILDTDHAIQFITYPGQTEPYGLHVWHRAGALSRGWCLADLRWHDPEGRVPDSACWQLVSRDPLHLEPSILCGRCGAHGWIRDGKWIDA